MPGKGQIPDDGSGGERQRVGLCYTCSHARVVPHPRGGPPYYRCALADTSARFAKYPQLPVLECGGYCPGEDATG